MKPFYNTENIENTIKNSVSNELNVNFKLHNISTANSETLLLADPPLQLLCPYEHSSKVEIFENTFEEIKQIELVKSTFGETESGEIYDDEISSYVSDFETILSINLDEFVDVFIIQTDKRVKQFYHIFKFNQFYITILNKYNEFLLPHYNTIMNNAIDLTTDLKHTIYKMFVSVEKTLQEVFNTNNIYTYQSTAMDSEKREMFRWILNDFAVFLQQMVDSYKQSHIDEIALKSKAEIMREEEKLQKMSKYDDLEDDQVFIFMELEKLMGISIDTNTMSPVDDDENEELFQGAEDDDLPE
jgi:hypothetical protein